MFRRIASLILRPRGPESEVTVVASGDPSMEAAIAQARETLPIFWRCFEAGAADSFQLKAGLSTPNGATEHLWLYPSGWREGKVVAILANQPRDLVDVGAGDEVLVDPDRITDWGYAKNGRLYGAFTQRAALHELSRSMRRQLEAVLAPTPLEPEPD